LSRMDETRRRCAWIVLVWRHAAGRLVWVAWRKGGLAWRVEKLQLLLLVLREIELRVIIPLGRDVLEKLRNREQRLVIVRAGCRLAGFVGGRGA